MYVSTYVLDIAALFYLMVLLYSSTVLNVNRKKPFLVGIILTVTIILAEMGTVFTDRSLSFRDINVLCNVLGFALTPVLPIALGYIFDSKIYKKYKILLIPSLVNIVATILSPVYGFIFYVDANNLYTRGDYFFIFITVYTINFLILFIYTLGVCKRRNYPIMWKLVVLSLFTLAGTSIQLVYPTAYSSWHCVTLSLLLFFLLMSEFDSSFDTLTGLYNRAAFDKATKHLAESKAFSVIALDINDFKNVNDTYGHDYGDTVIKAVAGIIRKSFGKQYTCYRCGGDEFIIISSEKDQEKIEFQLKTMINNLEEGREEGNPLPTISYGYSIFKGGEKLDFPKILKEADDQMYQFKKIYKADNT